MLKNLLHLSLNERLKLIENTITATNVVSEQKAIASQKSVIRKNVTTFSNILISILFCLGAVTTKAQNGYIYVHNKALDESSSVDFSYSVTGGTTTIPTFTLNDNPTQTTLLDVGAAENGRLWAVSRSNELFYRDANSTVWVKTSITGVSRVDGGPIGTCYYINTGGTVYSFSGSGAATQISAIGQFNFAPWADIASGWTGTPTSTVVAGPALYVVRDNGNIYKYSGSGTTWNTYASIAGSSQYRVDVNPANGNVYVGGNAGSVRTIRQITPAASPVITSLGSPVTDWSAYRDLAVNENGEIYVTAFDNYVDPKGWYVFKYTSGTTWAKELGSFDGSEITGGIANSMWLTMNSGGWGGSVATYPFYNIFSRAYNGSSVTYIDDERVRTTTGNSQLIPVAPGTYTLTEAVAAGWDLQNILLYDPTANSSSNILTGTAAINVSAGEVVHVVFQNGLDNPFTMTTSCSTAYLETFGVGSAVGSFGSVATGQTSYHYLSNNAPGEDGHYKLVNRANPDFNNWSGAAGIIDHTPGDGSLGYMYAVNAGYDKGEFFRRRFDGVIPGAKYTFSAWIVDLTASASVNPNVSFQVLDHTTQAVLGSYNTGDLTSTTEPDTWEKYGFTFTATANDIDLVINNNGVGGNGNDLAIDDISFVMLPVDTPVTTVVHTGCGTLGSVTISSPVGASFEYSKDGFVSSIQSSPVFSSLSPGIYTISARYVGTTGCVTSKIDTIGTTICGNIWDDANGDATNTSENPITSGVWVNLVNPSTGAVLKSVQVDASGNYSFTGLPQSTNYNIILSNTDQTGVSSLTTSSLPTGFVATGTNLSGVASTINKTGIISVNTGTSGITQQNFGIEQPPTPTAVTLGTTLNPGGTTSVTITSSFTGTDPDGVIDSIKITSFPTNVTSITIGTTTYTSGTWPISGVTFPVGTVVSLDPIDGAVTAVVPFVVIDNAGFPSTSSANLNLPFYITPPIANNIAATPMNNSLGRTAIPQLQASSPSGTAITSYSVLTLPPASEGVLYYCASAPVACTLGSLTAVSTSTALTPAQSESLYFDPAATFTGNVNFTYNAVDANGLLSNTANYTVPVINEPPVTINIRTAQMVDTTDRIEIPDLVAADKDGTIASYSISNVPASGVVLSYCATGTLPTCTITTIASGAGPTVLTPAQMLTLQADPTTGFSGDFVFNYTATDNNGNVSNTSSYTIPVVPYTSIGGNLPPVATNIISQNISNNAGATAIPNLLGTDPDGAVANYTINTIPTAAQGVLSYCSTGTLPTCTAIAITGTTTLTPAQALTLRFDPEPTFIGTAIFEYTATDNDGTPLTSAPATYQIPVVNTPPVANPDMVAPIANTVTTPTLLPPLSGSDYDGTVVTYNITTVPPSTSGTLQYCVTGSMPGCTLSTISGPITGLTPAQVATLNFTPNSGFTGNYVFNFTTVDNNGQVSQPAPFTIPVVAFDAVTGEPPIAYPYNSAPINSTSVANLSAALTGTDPDGTIASYTVTSITPANEGVLTYCVTGTLPGCTPMAVAVNTVMTPAQKATIQFTPNANFIGTATFNYTNLDNDGNLSNTATVTIPVVNNPPVAQNISNPPISVTSGATTLNPLVSTDADGTVVSYTILSIPSPGEGLLSVCTTAPSTGCVPVTVGQILTPAQVSQLTFTPNDTAHSPVVTFLYATTDNSGNGSNIAAVNIPINNAVILPIQLIQFTATKQGNKNALVEWLAGEEKADVQYHLQYSTTGQNWTTIAMQKANINGLSENKYSYLHSNLAKGKHLYRLMISNLANAKSYSPTRSVVIEDANNYQISLYPNPVVDKFTLNSSDGSVISEVKIYTNEGRLIATFTQVNSGAEINMNSYSAGFYVLKIKDKNGEIQVVKMMKK